MGETGKSNTQAPIPEENLTAYEPIPAREPEVEDQEEKSSSSSDSDSDDEETNKKSSKMSKKKRSKKKKQKEKRKEKRKAKAEEDKLKLALEAEDKHNKKVAHLLSIDERKRPYNSMYTAKEPTEEEMEAFMIKRPREEDPMLQFLGKDA